jgi:hypothetical protein
MNGPSHSLANERSRSTLHRPMTGPVVSGPQVRLTRAFIGKQSVIFLFDDGITFAGALLKG